MTAEETAEILMQSENLEASKIVLEQYKDECLKEIIKESSNALYPSTVIEIIKSKLKTT